MGENMTAYQPMMQKYWKELDQDEKIERMRQQVKQYESMLKRQNELIEKLMTHQHTQDGEIVSRIDRNSIYGVGQCIPPNNSDETYF